MGVVRVAITLSLVLFANQTATLVLSPILVDVAAAFDVSTATAGQLRSISGAVAGLSALTVGLWAGRLGLRRLLLAGLACLAAGVTLSALAPAFWVLAAAQVVLGLSLAILLSGAVAGATVWGDPARRADVLSVTFSGQAAAWLVGMPVVGIVGEVSWRLTWVVLPLAAGLVAAVLVTRLPEWRATPTSVRADLRLLASDRTLASWAAGELLAFSAWTGMLVYSGALLIESYGLSLTTTGVVLGLVFLAYLPGSAVARRFAERAAGRLLIVLALAAAVVVGLLGSVRPAAWVTVVLLVVFIVLNSGRTISGSVYGLDALPGRATTAMGIRASATQFGYLIGAGVGGLALALGGYAALGGVFACLYVLATVPHLALAVRPVRPAAR